MSAKLAAIQLIESFSVSTVFVVGHVGHGQRYNSNVSINAYVQRLRYRKTDTIIKAKQADLDLHPTRVDQNTGGALLESPMWTSMHGKSRVLSAISVELN